MSDAPPCLSCGACCFSGLETYVRVTGADHARLGELAEQVSVFIGNRCYMRMREGHCGALVIDRAGSYVCAVYQRRPEVCRALEQGSSACAAERSTKTQRALLGSQSLSRARPEGAVARAEPANTQTTSTQTANTRTDTLIVARGSAGPR